MLELLGWTAALLFLLFVLAGFKPVERWRLRKVPGPRPLWYLGNLPEMRKAGSYKFNQMCMHKWGKVFKVWGPAFPNVVIADPRMARTMLMHNLNRPEFPSLLPDTSGDKQFEGANILRARGDKWRGIRQAWTPLFFTGSLEAYSAVMNDCAGLLVERLQAAADSQVEVDIWSIFGDATMHVIGTAAFGLDFNTQVNAQGLTSEQQKEVQELRSASKIVFSSSVGMLSTRWFWLLLFLPSSMIFVVRYLAATFPDAAFRRALHARGTVITLACRLVADHRRHRAAQALQASQRPTGGGDAQVDIVQAGAQVKADKARAGNVAHVDAGFRRGVAPGSFIDLLVQAADRSTGQQLSDSQIASQAFTAILAGYETTANALSFCIYCLAANPDKQLPLLHEIDAFGERVPTYADLDQCFPYLDGVLREALRLYPPATFALRQAEHDQEIGGFHICKGEAISAAIYAIHHDKSLWHHAEEFIPERWIDGLPEAENRPAHAFMPFGEGPRKCVAHRFAVEEAKILLVRLHQKLVFKLAPGQVPLPLRHTITLSPKHGLMVTVHQRSTA